MVVHDRDEPRHVAAILARAPGVVLLPGALAAAVMGVLAGRIVDRYGAPVLTFMGAVLRAAVMFALSVTTGQSLPITAALTTLLGAGMALLNTPLAATITRIADARDFASALSLNTMVFFTGGSFGTTLLVALVGARTHASQAWNPLHSGESGAFSDAFAVLVLPMLLTAALATTRPRIHSEAAGRAPASPRAG